MDNTPLNPEENKQPQETSTPTPAPTNPTPVVGTGGRSVSNISKKKLFAVLAVFLLLGAGALWYFVFNKSDKSDSGAQNNTSNQTAEFQPNTFVQAGTEIKYLDEAGELKDYAAIGENDVLIEAITVNGTTELRYVTKQSAANSSTSLTAYGSVGPSGKKELFKFPANVDAYWSSIVASPDGSKVVAEVSNQSGFMSELIVLNVADGASKSIYKPADSKAGLMTVVAWRDDKTVLLQKQTCRQCDGPRLAELVALDIDSGNTSEFYKGDSGKLQYAGFVESKDGKSIYFMGGDYNKLFSGFGGAEPGAKFGNDYLFKIDKATGTAKQIAEFSNPDVSHNWLGEAENGVYVSTTSYVKTDDPFPAYSDSAVGNYNPVSKIQLVDESSGSVRDVAFESSLIKQRTTINRAFTYEGNLLVLVSNGRFDKYNFVDTTVDVLKLPLSGENNAITSLLQKTVKDEQSVKIFTARP